MPQNGHDHMNEECPTCDDQNDGESQFDAGVYTRQFTPLSDAELSLNRSILNAEELGMRRPSDEEGLLTTPVQAIEGIHQPTVSNVTSYPNSTIPLTEQRIPADNGRDAEVHMPSLYSAPWFDPNHSSAHQSNDVSIEQSTPFPPPHIGVLTELLDFPGRLPPGRTDDAQPLIGRTTKEVAGPADSDTINPPAAGEAGAASCEWKKSYWGMASVAKAIHFDVRYKYAWFYDLRDALSSSMVSESDMTQETVVGEKLSSAIDRAKNAVENIVAGGYLPPASEYGNLITMLEGHINNDTTRPNPCAIPCPRRHVDLNSWNYSHKTWSHPQIFTLPGSWTWEWVWQPKAGWWLFRVIRKRVLMTYTLHFHVEYTVSCLP